MALQKPRKGKRSRRESDRSLRVEEISPDDMGYDGDIEVVRPDQYEEAESDFEDEHGKNQWLWPDTDDELAGRLRRLSCDPHVAAVSPSSSRPSREDESGSRGVKRQSKDTDELHPDVESPESWPRHVEIEVSELVDDQGGAGQPPTKKRKKKAAAVRQQSATTSYRVDVQKINRAEAAWSDSSDKTDDDHDEVGMDSTNSGTPATLSTPIPAEPRRDLDFMDLG